jgi:hypothetical protein
MVIVLSEGIGGATATPGTISQMSSHPAGTGESFQSGNWVEVTTPSGSVSQMLPSSANVSAVVQNVVAQLAGSTSDDTYLYKGESYSTPEDVQAAIRGNILGSESVQHILEVQTTQGTPGTPGTPGTSPNMATLAAIGIGLYLLFGGAK